MILWMTHLTVNANNTPTFITIVGKLIFIAFDAVGTVISQNISKINSLDKVVIYLLIISNAWSTQSLVGIGSKYQSGTEQGFGSNKFVGY